MRENSSWVNSEACDFSFPSFLQILYQTFNKLLFIRVINKFNQINYLIFDLPTSIINL